MQNNKNDEFSVIPKEGEFRSASEEVCLIRHGDDPCECDVDKEAAKRKRSAFEARFELSKTKNPAKDEVSGLCDNSTKVEASIVAQDGAQVEGLREQVLTEFKQVLKLAPADYTENCTNVVMSLIATATAQAYERCLEAVGEDDELLGEQLYPDSFYHADEHNSHFRMLNNLRAEIRQRLAERSNNGRGEKS